MDLKEFRATVLRLDKPEEVLRLADRYLGQLEKMGADFVLPRNHVIVKPVLEYYAGDLPGWVKFVKSVRDRLPGHGRKYHEGVHELYRTLLVRLTQEERRARLDAAVKMALKKGLIPDQYDAKMAYARKCTQVWKLRKDNMLKIHAKTKGPITLDERETMLAEFWQMIDEEIANGEVPKP